jgi:hypothetical protein
VLPTQTARMRPLFTPKDQTCSIIEKHACRTEAPEDIQCIERISGVIVR